MSDPTSLLFGLDDYTVIEVTLSADSTAADEAVGVVIETSDPEAACPGCGVMSTRVKDRPLRQITDLPASGQRVALWLRGRRLV